MTGKQALAIVEWAREQLEGINKDSLTDFEGRLLQRITGDKTPSETIEKQRANSSNLS